MKQVANISRTRLVLSRREGESIEIGGTVTVTVLKRKSDGSISLAIEAPKDVKILRTELLRKNGASDTGYGRAV